MWVCAGKWKIKPKVSTPRERWINNYFFSVSANVRNNFHVQFPFVLLVVRCRRIRWVLHYNAVCTMGATHAYCSHFRREKWCLSRGDRRHLCRICRRRCRRSLNTSAAVKWTLNTAEHSIQKEVIFWLKYLNLITDNKIFIWLSAKHEWHQL